MYDYTDPARDEYLSTGCDPTGGELEAYEEENIESSSSGASSDSVMPSMRGLMPSSGKSFRKCGAGKRQIE